MFDHKTTYTLRVTLSSVSNTAALLRIVSIMHNRRVDILHLCFSATNADVASMTAVVTLSNISCLTLQESVRRSVEVIEVLADEDPLSSCLCASERRNSL